MNSHIQPPQHLSFSNLVQHNYIACRAYKLLTVAIISFRGSSKFKMSQSATEDHGQCHSLESQVRGNQKIVWWPYTSYCFIGIIFIPVREIDFPKQHWLDQPQLLTKGQRLSSDPLIPFALRSRPMWNTLAAQTDPTWHVAGSQAIPPQFRCRILKQFELPGTSLVGVSQFQGQMFRKVLDRVLQASRLCQRHNAMKRNKTLYKLVVWTEEMVSIQPT